MVNNKTENFIEKSRIKHGDTYDYSKVIYVNSCTKVCIICPEHGEFWQTPTKHLSGQGCPVCGKIKSSQKKLLTRDDFIRKSIKIHGCKYDYSKVNYVNNSTKVCIICPEHGEFWQTPASHLIGNGCQKCNGGVKYTKESFIEKAKALHGDKYDYSKVNYVGVFTKVCIICPEHGEFWQTPASHLQGQGCPKCSNRIRLTTEEFIRHANEIHGDKYDYSKVKYINNHTKVCIICPIHGEFWQTPYKHIRRRQGCPKCIGRGFDKEEILQKFCNVHGDKYDYSKVQYIDGKTKVCIICPEHGEFWQTPASHLQGHGCPICGSIKNAKSRTMGYDSFVKRSKLIFGGLYDYSKVKYINAKTPVLLSCKKHGEFYVTPDVHIYSKCGCPLCSHTSSIPESEIFTFLRDGLCLNDIEEHNRDVISPKEIDFYLPYKKLGIEYNGLFWHSEYCMKDEYYHINKLNECKAKGVSLIQIFEDEYLNHKELVLSKIRHILQKDDNLPKIYARKCTVREISYSETSDFLDKNHIQGRASASVYIGCFYSDKLIGAMLFKKTNRCDSKYELVRFATDINYICCGVGGKLFSYFVKKYNPLEIKSFADRRWTINEDDNLYTKLGFINDGHTKPDYRYYNTSFGSIRIHKFNMRRDVLIKKYGADPSDSESEMTRKLGFYKVWDCGLIRYIWVKPKQ